MKLVNRQKLGQQLAVTQRASDKYLEECIYLEIREKKNQRRNNLEKQEKTVSWNLRDIYKERREAIKCINSYV